VSKIRDRVAEGLYRELQGAIDQLWDSPEFATMESEIERAMAAYFLFGSRLHDRLSFRLGYPEEPFSGYFIVPQYEIGRYRVDFLFGSGKAPDVSQCVAIECDGFEFHDRTPEQAARDKARDRELNQHVKAVVRFTGREIYRDAGACWLDALKILMREHAQ